MPVRIVCLGGGHFGAALAKHLNPAVRRGLVEVTFVDRDNFSVFHGFIHEMLCAKVQPSQIASPARRLFPPSKFHNGEIERIDLAAQTITASRTLDGREYVLPYDHLVIGLGTIDDLSRYAGTAEHAQKLKTYADCFKCRNHIIAMLELADIEPDPAERRRLLTFVVVGGNFGGTEVATELYEYLHSLTQKEYPGIKPEEIKVLLISSGPQLLPELGQHHRPLVEWAERFLETSGVDIRYSTKVTAATPEEVVLSTGEKVPSRTLISCSGTAPSPVLDGLDLQRDERGRVKVDENLRALGHKNVWAGGDCAAVPHPKGGSCPQLAIYAKTQARQVAENLIATATDRKLKRYRFTGLGDAVSLGRRRAVGHLKGIRLTGFVAWVAWRLTLLQFVPTMDRRIRLVIDWMLWPIFGRDVVSIRTDDSVGVRREHYEPGQEIVREGEIGRRLYIVWDGEVEVVRSDPSGPEVLATLGRGQHFGETAVFQNVRRTASVRARTQVDVLSIGHKESLALSVMGSFGDTVSKLPVKQS